MDPIDYVRISADHLAWPQGAVYAHLGLKIGFFSNFTRILWFFWGLVFVLFYSPKDVVFGEI